MTLTEILNSKKRDELTAFAKALKISKYSSMKKAELVEVLSSAINADNAALNKKKIRIIVWRIKKSGFSNEKL